MGFLDRLFGKKQKTMQPLVIYGLCSPIGVGAHKSGEAYYWTASVILSAWRADNEEEVHVEKIHMEKECDEEGVHALQAQLKGSTIFHARVRRSESGFELLELLEVPCEDEQLERLVPKETAKTLEAVEEEAVQKVETEKETVVFGKEEITLNGSGEEATHLFYQLKKRQVGWRSDALKLAADHFVPTYNERLEKGKKLTKKEIKENSILHSITLSEDGGDAFTFHFIFSKGDKQISLDVSGTIAKGMSECRWHEETAESKID